MTALRLLSLGAGVQSTTLALMAVEGRVEPLDGAIFADTGWEPRRVYAHLDRLKKVLGDAGIPLYRVSTGNIRADVLNPNKMRSVPAYTASRPYQVTVVDEWGPCPDESCGWRRLRVVRDEVGEPDSLFAVEALDLARAGPLDEPTPFEPGTPLDAIDAEAQREQTEDDEVSSATFLAQALRAAGMDRLPPVHEACGSSGRVPIAQHMETRRDYGMLGRKCTQQYKLRPILEQVRLLLGARGGAERPCRYCKGTGARVAPWRAKRGESVAGECSVCEGLGTLSRIGQPPAGAWAEQWIGFSTDEITRVSSRGDTRYARSRYPLLELGMSRADCEAWLASRGWTSVAKSSCVGCPFHGNAEWRRMRDEDPAAWADAVSFDEEYRHGPGMRQERYLHISCRPLSEAPIDFIRPGEWRQDAILPGGYDAVRAEGGDPDGCSPYACRSGEPVAVSHAE